MGKIYFKILLLGFACILMASYTYPQVVQYEYKEKYYNHRGKYAVLQVDYTNKRFVYRLSCDAYRPDNCIMGYIEMYGVFEEKMRWLWNFNNISPPKKYNEQKFEMEIYEWLFMKFVSFYEEYYPTYSKKIEGKGNPKMTLVKYSDDFVEVTWSNIHESRYPEFYSLFSHAGEAMKRTKKIKLDKKMYVKEMYKYIVKVRENLIYNDEAFSTFDNYFNRIYRGTPIPSVYSDGYSQKVIHKKLLKMKKLQNE